MGLHYPPDKDPRKSPYWPKKEDYSYGVWLGRVRYAWDAWNRNRQKAKLPRVDPPLSLNINTTMRPPLDKSKGKRPTNASISFFEWQRRNKMKSGPLIAAFDKTKYQEGDKLIRELDQGVADTNLSPNERDEINNILKELNSGSISVSDFDDQDGAGPSGVTTEATTNSTEMSSAGTQNKRPRTEVSDDATPEPMEGVSTAAAASGHNSSSDGGFDSAQGPISLLPKGGYKVNSGHMMFRKVHRMKSWAVPFFNIPEPLGSSNWCTTPLQQIPWEYAYFYLSPEEFNLLPAGSYIHSVHVDIMETVASTGYPTGATTSTVATTNHPKVLQIGFDITNKLRGGQFRKLTLESNCKPTGTVASTLAADFPTKQYGTDQTAADGAVVIPGVSTKIPYYNFNHFCMYQPNAADAITRGFDATNAPGYEYYANAITEINANDVTWDKVASYSYKFESAPVGAQFAPLEIQTNNVSNATGSATLYNAKRGIGGINPGVPLVITETYGPSNTSDIPLVTYSSSVMEKGATFVKGDQARKPARQPSLGIGMRAIEKASPDVDDSRAGDFVQANIEFEITATMIVSLPAYPNRFIKPKYYNTSIENAPAGTGSYQGDSNSVVTFGLPNITATAPAVAAVDQVLNEPTEEGIIARTRSGRPRRDVPRVPPVLKPGTKEYKDYVKKQKTNIQL